MVLKILKKLLYLLYYYFYGDIETGWPGSALKVVKWMPEGNIYERSIAGGADQKDCSSIK